MRISVVALLVIAACSSPLLPRNGIAQTDIPVKSWEHLHVGQLNVAIEQAVAAGSSWPSSPALATLELLGGDSETRTLSLTEEKNRLESPDTAVVIMTRDGFLDDAVRGDWHRLVFSPSSGDTWRVVEARRALRCWRVDTDIFRAGPCP